MGIDEWIRVISLIGFPAFVTLVLLVGIGYALGKFVWPWTTNEIKENRVAFTAMVKSYNDMLAERDKQRHAEHGEQLQVNAKQQQSFTETLAKTQNDFLTALSAQRFEFMETLGTQRTDFIKELSVTRETNIQALTKRDDATANMVQALDDLTEQVAEMKLGKRPDK